MKFRFTLFLLCLFLTSGAQTVYSSHVPCGNVRYYTLENVAEAMWYQLNDTTGELHFYDLKRQTACLVAVNIHPEAVSVYNGSSDLFSKVTIDLTNSSRLRLTIIEKENAEPVVLQLPVTPSTMAVPVDYHCFGAVRSIYYDNEEGRDSVTMTIEHMYPIPAAGVAAIDSLRLMKALLSIYDGLPVDAVYPDDIIRNFDITFIQDYTSMYESGEAEIDEYSSMWSVYDEVSILFQKNGLIGFVSAGYEYTGGVHGTYGSSNYTYDSESDKLLMLEDLFVMNFDAELESAINNQLRQDLQIEPEASLTDEGFFVEIVTATQNFMLSESAITFHYNVYEIAPYAAGSIDITVPYSAISGIIQADIIRRMKN